MLRFIQANGLRMHIIDEGTGPLVVLLHGFPEFSGTWRHQVRALVAAGYRVVAPDQRGYGQTDCPAREDAYTILHLVGDVIGLLDALGEEQAVVVGHDWGAPVAWNAALLRPDRVCAVAGLSVPPRPRAPAAPTAGLRRLFGDDYYMLYFQQQGTAERDFEADVRAGLRSLMYAASASAAPEHRWQPVARGGFFAGIVDPGAAPAWLGEPQLDALTDAFARSGFRGGLSWYRNLDRNWELATPFVGLTIRQPSLFVIGDADPGYPAARPAPRIRPKLLVSLAFGLRLSTERMGLSGCWVIFFVRAMDLDPASCLVLMCHRERTRLLSSGSLKPWTLRTSPFRGLLPTARTLAHLRIAEPVEAVGAGNRMMNWLWPPDL